MTTTTILSHHQPPLKTRNPVFLRTNYYGSVGRPCNGKRKSAVELLQESKAHYVKSESVLDTKQELKYTDHLRVRSPNAEHLGLVKEGTHTASFAFAVCPICSPYQYHQCYPYATTTKRREHFDHFQLQSLEHHYIAHYNRSRKENRENGGEWNCNNRINKSAERRASVPSTNSFPTFYLKPLQIQRDLRDNLTTTTTSSGGSSSKSSNLGMPLPKTTTATPPTTHSWTQDQAPSTSFASTSPQQRHSSVSSTSTSSRTRRTNNVATSTTIDKGITIPSSSSQTSTTNIPTTCSLITSSTSLISTQQLQPQPSNHGNNSRERRDGKEDSPPPLPPKSPRSTKPVRPHDFPQKLTGPGNPPATLPPPPPRRTTSTSSATIATSEYHQPEILHTKLKRLIQHDVGGSRKHGALDGIIPITLPSPILVPTPPDIMFGHTEKSPMSDSGPIISPPPAFSTPVTPMLDRQNSTISDKSASRNNGPSGGNNKLPLSSTVSIPSSISSSKSRKSADMSDVSMLYVSPRSPVDLDISTSLETEQSESIETGNEEEESPMECRVVVESNDNSNTGSSPPPPPKSIMVSKKSPIPKSMTENALYNVCNKLDGVPPSSQNRSSSHQPLLPNQTHLLSSKSNENSSFLRRPILRSKSDLSHRYKKAGSSFNLIGGLGFTLVHVDLGLNTTPPLPPPTHTISSYCQTQQSSTLTRNFSTSSSKQQQQQQPSSKPSAELERFFNMLGLESQASILESSLPSINTTVTAATIDSSNNGKKSGGSSPVFFSSVSSIESEPRRGGSIDSGDSPVGVPKIVGSRTIGGGGDYGSVGMIPIGVNNTANNGVANTIVVQHGEPSIVERNARVIKWLFNCRKAVEMSNKR